MRFIYNSPKSLLFSDAIDDVVKLVAPYTTGLYLHEIYATHSLTGSDLEAHSDIVTANHVSDELVIVAYFNDDFEGGEIYFPELGLEQKNKRGSIVMFPPKNYAYNHGARKVTKGEKFLLNLCFTTDKSRDYYSRSAK